MTSIASELALNQIKEKDKFNKLPFDFYFEYNIILKSESLNNSNFGYAKLSPNLISYYSLLDKKLYILDDKKITNNIFNNFLNFVKTSNKFSKKEIKFKKGIFIKIKWANKIKYLFKKKPSVEETKEYLIKIFKEINFIK